MKQTRVCRRCKTSKPFSDFGKASAEKFGIRYDCKPCCVIERKAGFARMMADPKRKKAYLLRSLKWRENNKDKIRAKGVRYQQTSTRPRESTSKWRANNPEKSRAHYLLNKSVYLGKLAKPSICSRCGKEAVIHGHHDDYSKPLDVIWVCSKCHKIIHGLVKYL